MASDKIEELYTITQLLPLLRPYGKRTNSPTQRLTLKLYKSFLGKCHWCKCTVQMPASGHGKMHQNTATADHLYSIQDIRRTLNRNVVLCCNKCNAKRNDAETKLINSEYRAKNNKLVLIQTLLKEILLKDAERKNSKRKAVPPGKWGNTLKKSFTGWLRWINN